MISLEEKQEDKIKQLNEMWEHISEKFAYGTKTNIKERAIKLLRDKNISISEALFEASEEICTGRKNKHKKTKSEIELILKQYE